MEAGSDPNTEAPESSNDISALALPLAKIGLASGIIGMVSNLADAGVTFGGGQGLTIGGASAARSAADTAIANASAASASADMGNRAKAAALGAAVGAGIGSFLPVLGTGIGAIVGAGIGFVVNPDFLKE